MLSFLARSAFCIGAVAAAASGVGVRGLATAVDRGAREAAGDAGQACAASEACLRAGAAALSGITAGAASRVSGGRASVPAGAGPDGRRPRVRPKAEPVRG